MHIASFKVLDLDNTAPKAKAKVSTSILNCFSGSGHFTTRSKVTMSISWFKASSASLVHSNTSFSFFLVNSTSGFAIFANPLICGLWYPKTPRTICMSFLLFRVLGQFFIPAILSGLIQISPFPTCHPSRFMVSTPNLLLLSLMKYEFSSSSCSTSWVICSCNFCLAVSFLVTI